jgi:hypothetical protein
MLDFGEILKHKCVEKSMCKAWAIIYLYSNGFNMKERILAPNCSAKNFHIKVETLDSSMKTS